MAQRKPGPDDASPIKVVSVELFLAAEPLDVFDIQVEEDESFIVGGVVVHNSMVCASLDGQVFDIDTGPQPPRHPNCRSSSIPVMKSWKEMGFNFKELPESTRASMDGQIPESMTYNDWLRKRSASEQDDILGKTKGKLYRDGGLDVQNFVDRTGSEMNLDELRRTEADAFRKAGL